MNSPDYRQALGDSSKRCVRNQAYSVGLYPTPQSPLRLELEVGQLSIPDFRLPGVSGLCRGRRVACTAGNTLQPARLPPQKSKARFAEVIVSHFAAAFSIPMSLQASCHRRSERNFGVSVSVALLLAVFGSVTPAGAVTVAVSRSNPSRKLIPRGQMSDYI